MRCIDWREAAVDVMAPLYAAEQTRWLAELDWDAGANWVLIETARTQGTLPGYLALDRGGDVVGWAFYYLHQTVLQIGGLTGRTHTAARTLLNTIMHSPEAAQAREVACFVLPDRPATSALVQRRFEALAFLYLRRDLRGLTPVSPRPGGCAAEPGSAVSVRPWQASADAPDTVRLLESAYADTSAARCFAGRDGRAGWVHYVRQLIRTPACGVLLPTASFSARDAGDGLCGAVLTTSIGSGAAHVAQLVVDPARARQGLGRRLLDAACHRAAGEGRRYLTLLVAEDNGPARSLYARTGFEERSRFLFGWRSRPIPRAGRAAA